MSTSADGAASPSDPSAVEQSRALTLEDVITQLVTHLRRDGIGERPAVTNEFISDLAFDSLALLELYALLEDLYGISIVENHLAFDQLSIRDLVEFLGPLLDRSDSAPDVTQAELDERLRPSL